MHSTNENCIYGGIELQCFLQMFYIPFLYINVFTSELQSRAYALS